MAFLFWLDAVSLVRTENLFTHFVEFVKEMIGALIGNRNICLVHLCPVALHTNWKKPGNPYPPDNSNTFFQNPKVIFGFILFLVVAGFGFGAYRLANGIKGGFVPARLNVNSQETTLGSVSGQEAERDETLKTKDTDSDGLNDYDELYIYRTSPYLKDTDSDGADDKVEIDKGKDPNCPEGQTCKQFVPTTGDSQQSTPTPLGDRDSDQSVGAVNSQQELLGIPGLDSEALDGQGEANTTDVSEEGGISPELDQGTTEVDLQNLTAPQIRDLLLQSGKITQEQLDQIDDETLMGVYREVIEKQ